MAPRKRKKQRHHHSLDISSIEEEIEAMFNKKFLLKSNEETWCLPHASCMFEDSDSPFVLEDMITMKDELNRTKSLLNDMDIVQWHLHTRRANKAGLVVKHLRENLHAEMCTQAWAKFHEVLGSFDLIPQVALDANKFRSVHLCEAPGAFVTSLNHFVKSHHRGLVWDWLGTTLNPYYEGHDLTAMLDDDRFILETLSHWHFGTDETGDLMNPVNLQALQADAAEVHLVTADGSIDCADQPAEQESLVAQLIFCEAVAAITLLSKGGNFVFKMFTAFEHRMICLLYLLSCLFQEIHVIKPGTSKSGNSEVYVTCLKFAGKQEIPLDVMEKLKNAYSPHCPTQSLFPLSSIPSAFLESLKICEKFFTGLSMEAIDLHIQQFHHMSPAEKNALFHLRHLVVQRFVDKFLLQPISKADHVVPGAQLDGTQLSFTRGPTNDVPFSESFSGRHQTGSFNERQNNLGQDWLEKFQADGMFQFNPARCTSLQGLSQANNGVPLISLYSDQVTWLERTNVTTPEVTTQRWKPKIGLPVDNVFNSRFCTPSYINKLKEARAHVKILQKENSHTLETIMNKVNPSNLVAKAKGSEAELRNLDNLVSYTEMAKGNDIGLIINLSESLSGLTDYLQAKNARFKSIHIRVSPESGQQVLSFEQNTIVVPKVEDILDNIRKLCNPEGDHVKLAFVDLDSERVREGKEELDAKREFLSHCIIALRLLESGGMLVCHIFETLTRFSVGILYVLHQLFNKITVVKPVMSQLHSPRRFLVCKGFHDDSKHLITFLESVSNQLARIALDSEMLHSDVLEIVPMKKLYSEQFYFFVKRVNEQLAHLQLQSIVQLENFFLNPEKIPSASEIACLTEEVKKYLES